MAEGAVRDGEAPGARSARRRPPTKTLAWSEPDEARQPRRSQRPTIRTGRRGRPRLAIDAGLIEKLAALHCTPGEIATVVGCSTDSLHNNFSAAVAKGRERGKFNLRRAQVRLALSGNATMLIWLGKQ